MISLRIRNRFFTSGWPSNRDNAAVADFGVFESVPLGRRRRNALARMVKPVILTEISLVLVVNIVPRTPMKSARSRCWKMANCSSPRTFFCA